MNKKQQTQYDRFREEQRKREGEVTIQNKKNKPPKTETFQEGEYVDFEEINNNE